MADILRFEPLGQPENPNWQRFPRFDEVGAQIDAQAGRIFDTATSLSRGSELYARVEQRLRSEDRPLLRELYDAITRPPEPYQPPAYRAGLRAGGGNPRGLPPILDDARPPDEPQRA